MLALLIRFAATNDPCSGGSFLDFPTWYKYLPGDHVNGACNPRLESLSDIYLIGAAILEILLRIAAFAAFAYLIYGGVTYVTSQGEPDKTQKAKMTIINALGGLLVAISATAVVVFIGNRIH